MGPPCGFSAWCAEHGRHGLDIRAQAWVPNHATESCAPLALGAEAWADEMREERESREKREKRGRYERRERESNYCDFLWQIVILFVSDECVHGRVGCMK